MPQKRLRAVFMRGGTSKGVIFRREDLPDDQTAWDAIFLATMGSPDPNGRQLDGMGGGVSSLSKVCVVGPSSRPNADVDYTFAQVSVSEALVDYAGNCGNMSAAIGPFAVDEGLVAAAADGEIIVRIHNTNTGKVIASRFRTEAGQAAVDGDFVLDGVVGTAAPVRLDFLDPGGSKTGRLLPSGNPVDRINLDGFGLLEVSLVDAGNPFVFVAASDLGLSGTEMPKELAACAELMDRLESIRQIASVHMGLASDRIAAAAMVSIPKIALLAPPKPSPTLSGRIIEANQADIVARTISVGQPHNAIPLTGSLCLAAALRTPGTIAHRLAGVTHSETVRVAHPSGITSVDATMEETESGTTVRHATVYRTARRLFAGEIYFMG